MPNHCENDLWIKGPKEVRDAVKQLLSSPEGEIDYNKVIPYPESFTTQDRIAAEWNKEAEEKRQKGKKVNYNNRPTNGFNSGGYEWCITRWGTKWNAYHVRREDRSRSLFYSFNSAWAPPFPIIEALAKMFPQATIIHKYYERGMAYQGKIVWENGQQVEAIEKDYHGSRGG